MATTFDLSDVPAADAADLSAAMRAFIESGRGLILLNGASDADLDAACALLNDRHRTQPQRALTAFVRLGTLSKCSAHGACSSCCSTTVMH
ncbi:MAG: hypothetical protein WDN31_16045 [Hyphomicrobium sp.]